jgi:hypothetical protein
VRLLPTLLLEVNILTAVRCSGFTLTSEDSSEVAFLLVENYNYDCSNWPSGRLGIFDTYSVRNCAFRWFLWLGPQDRRRVAFCPNSLEFSRGHDSALIPLLAMAGVK